MTPAEAARRLDAIARKIDELIATPLRPPASDARNADERLAGAGGHPDNAKRTTPRKDPLSSFTHQPTKQGAPQVTDEKPTMNELLRAARSTRDHHDGLDALAAHAGEELHDNDESPEPVDPNEALRAQLAHQRLGTVHRRTGHIGAVVGQPRKDQR